MQVPFHMWEEVSAVDFALRAGLFAQEMNLVMLPPSFTVYLFLHSPTASNHLWPVA